MINHDKVFLTSAVLMLILISLVIPVSAISLSVTKSVINDVVVSDLNEPAVFTLHITNNGADDRFTVYSLVGVDITPAESLFIPSGSTKDLTIRVTPNSDLRRDAGPLIFVYKIRGDNSGIFEDTLSVNIVGLSEAFGIGAYGIDPESDTATVYFKNNYNIDYDELSVRFHSAFFDFTEEFSISALENKEFSVPISHDDIASLTAGQYLFTSTVTTDGVTRKIDGSLRFNEKQFISTDTEDFGFAIRKTIVEKTNDGNLPAVAEVSIKKNVISRLFTTFNVEPSSVDREGLSVYYSWQRELRPSESFTVKVTTNWFYPLLIIIGAVVLGFFISLYRRTHLMVRKRVSFIRTKGGEFALRVSLHLSAKSSVSKIKVYDRVPAVARLYDKYQSNIKPDRFDAKNRRLEWDVGSLDSGEVRVLSYIIYSRVGVVGKFELPRATAVYEKDGLIVESQSNRAFILAEAKGSNEEF